MRLFYDPNIFGDFHILQQEESHHCTKVLRLSQGDEIFLTDGKGFLYQCEIVEIHQKKTLVKIIEQKEGDDKRNYKLHIAIGPTKSNERTEWFVEKATEIGIDEITPIICKNSERKIIKNVRLNKVVEAAMKQSYKTLHPIINEQIDFLQFIELDFGNIKKFIAHCENIENKKYLGNILEKSDSVLILIGPEGDFTLDEIELAKNAGFIPISLGKSRLRTETAGIVASNICSVINQFE
ncbi:MAG: 16S rRNA (uracil(1498)-N(3))-methyltransferase [Bacteroidales bacterium]|nr:16S rRNA (uracil(1498)-N(3))-methyltransferase [Bacteroidales bacterium]